VYESRGEADWPPGWSCCGAESVAAAGCVERLRVPGRWEYGGI
jgi:hypothetical protein